MKRCFYILLFVIFGVVLQFIVHAIIEIWYIGLLSRDFERYGLGLTWDQWVRIHHASAVILFLAGLGFGFWQGRFWWKKLYERNNMETGRNPRDI